MTHSIWQRATFSGCLAAVVAFGAARGAAQDSPSSPATAGADAGVPASPDVAPAASSGAAPAASSGANVPPDSTAAPKADVSRPAPAPHAAAPASAEVDPIADQLVSAELAQAEQPTLQFYGFADFTYQKLLVSQSNAWAKVGYAGDGSFAVGNLNLYMSADLGKGWRSLAEVRFTYLPLGAETTDANGLTTHLNTQVRDYADFERPMQWGGIEIERAYVEYSFSEWLSVRAGQWLTPYGIWNVDHGSPTIIAVQRPFTVGEDLFPERQTGLQLGGKFLVDATTLGYALTLSNGRGPVAAYRDYDNNKAVGVRLWVENRSRIGRVSGGVSGYKGKYTDANRQYTLDTTNPNAVVESHDVLLEQYDELSLAADLQWDWDALHTQSEIIMNETRYNDSARPLVVDVTGSGFVPDYRRWGVYGLVAYRLPVLTLMPYGMIEYYNFAASPSTRSNVPAATAIYAGLNIRPTPRVTLKAQYILGIFHERGSAGSGRDNIGLGQAQIAWSF